MNESGGELEGRLLKSLSVSWSSHHLGLSSDGQEKFEFWGELVFGVEAVGEVNSANAAVRVDLYAEGFDVVGSVSAASEIGQVELNLVPAFVKSHWHGANERFHAGCALVV